MSCGSTSRGRRQLDDRAAMEDLSFDGSAFDHRSLRDGELVDPCLEECLHGRGHTRVTVLACKRQHLLDEERIPLRGGRGFCRATILGAAVHADQLGAFVARRAARAGWSTHSASRRPNRAGGRAAPAARCKGAGSARRARGRRCDRRGPGTSLRPTGCRRRRRRAARRPPPPRAASGPTRRSRSGASRPPRGAQELRPRAARAA